MTRVGDARRSGRACAVAFAVIVLVISACSQGEDGHGNYVAIDPVTATPGGGDLGGPDTAARSDDRAAGTTDDIQGRPVPAADLAEVTRLWDRFLGQRAAIIAADGAPAALEPLATSQAIAQVEELRADNDQRIRDEKTAALTELHEWSNVASVDYVNADRVRLVDCTERQRANLFGTPSIVFVTNAVEIVRVGDLWKVDRVRTIQDGIVGLTVDDLGCVPPSFAERAVRIATEGVDFAAGAFADPRAVDTIPASIQGDARERLRYALDRLLLEDLTRTPDEQVHLRVEGMDLNKPEFTVVVSVCRHYPTGRAFVDGHGVSTPLEIGPGESQLEYVHVAVEPVASGTESADAIVDIRSGPSGCWESA